MLAAIPAGNYSLRRARKMLSRVDIDELTIGLGSINFVHCAPLQPAEKPP
jgi:hypothetical protein